MKHTPKLTLHPTHDIHALADSIDAFIAKVHQRLKCESSTGGVEDAYSILTEKYALTSRVTIMRNNFQEDLTFGVIFSLESIVEIIDYLGEMITTAHSLDQVRSIVNDVSVLAISIFPGKSDRTNFILKDLSTKVNEHRNGGNLVSCIS